MCVSQGLPRSVRTGQYYAPLIEIAFGSGTTATAINEAGDVVGYAGFPAANPQGFIVRGFRYTAVGPVAALTGEGVPSMGLGINDAGVVAGSWNINAMIVSPTGEITTYPWGVYASNLWGVNESGQFAGWALSTQPPGCSVFSPWRAGAARRVAGTPVLGKPGPGHRQPRRVVGVSILNSGAGWDVGDAFVFNGVGPLQKLNDLVVGGSTSFARLSLANATNGNTIVGHGMYHDGFIVKAFSYREGIVNDIGPYVTFGNNYQSAANGINQRGDIVGITFGNQGDNSRPFIYTAEGQAYNLNEFVDPESGWIPGRQWPSTTTTRSSATAPATASSAPSR